MANEGRVAWREGLFLRPQHFQQQDRHFDVQLQARASGLGPYPWGVRELKLNGAMAALGKFAIERCSGVLPDGTPFSLPQDGPLPEPLDFPASERDAIVYLTLPPRQGGTAEFAEADATRLAARYVVDEVEVFDSFADERTSELIEVARANLRFGVLRDQIDGRVKLGLARVRELHGGALVMDDHYIAPCTDIASGRLARCIEDLLGRAEQKVGVLALRAVEATDGGAATFASYLILQTLNRWVATLKHLKGLPNVHPERLYEAMASMYGELATSLRPDERRPADYPAYDHEDLQGCFEPLYKLLQKALSLDITPTAGLMPLDPLGSGSYAAKIVDHDLFDDCNFYLAVSARKPQEAIRTSVPGNVKVGSSLNMRMIIESALKSNIPLSPVAVPPPQIRILPGFVYFELDRSVEAWADFQNAPAVGVHIAGDWPELQLELWHVKRHAR